MQSVEKAAAALGQGLEKAVPLAQAAAVIGVTWVGWQIYKRLTVAGDAIGSGIGEIYASITSPDVVEPQIKLQSRYFTGSGVLTNDAETVIREGYPNLYRALFIGGRIKPQYSHLIDSGQALKDSDYA